jgi:hypothetical protein
MKLSDYSAVLASISSFTIAVMQRYGATFLHVTAILTQENKKERFRREKGRLRN